MRAKEFIIDGLKIPQFTRLKKYPTYATPKAKVEKTPPPKNDLNTAWGVMNSWGRKPKDTNEL